MFERWFAPVWERVSEQCALQHQHQQLSRAERFDHSPEQTFISSICIGEQHFYRLRCILALLLHVKKYWRRCHLHHNQSRLISINVVCRLIALSHHHSEALDSWAMINKQYRSQSDVLCVGPRRKNEWKWERERDSEEESDLDARTHFETEQIAHKLPDSLSVCPGDRTLLPTTGRWSLADDDLHSSSSSALHHSHGNRLARDWHHRTHHQRSYSHTQSWLTGWLSEWPCSSTSLSTAKFFLPGNAAHFIHCLRLNISAKWYWPSKNKKKCAKTTIKLSVKVWNSLDSAWARRNYNKSVKTEKKIINYNCGRFRQFLFSKHGNGNFKHNSPLWRWNLFSID